MITATLNIPSQLSDDYCDFNKRASTGAEMTIFCVGRRRAELDRSTVAARRANCRIGAHANVCCHFRIGGMRPLGMMRIDPGKGR